MVELAERLSSQEPVDARGVAQVRLLLIGVVGPLYDCPRANDLEPALRRRSRRWIPASSSRATRSGQNAPAYALSAG